MAEPIPFVPHVALDENQKSSKLYNIVLQIDHVDEILGLPQRSELSRVG